MNMGMGGTSGLFAGLCLVWAALAGPAGAQAPLFADDAPVSITITGPINAILRAPARDTDARPAILTLDADGRAFNIELSPRGLSRRRSEVCSFPPLRVEFADGSVSGTLFRGQGRLKLVTHCRPQERFEQLVMLEYTAYRLYNLVTPMSFRVRPLDVAYEEPNSTSAPRRHFGFFIEDVDDVAKRNGRVELEAASEEISVDQFDPAATTHFALFQYMIGNLDWDYRYGPVGEACCHNSKLITLEGARTHIVPLPYDFDFSGFVDAPYAAPPAKVNISSVRTRFFRGRCRHNGELEAAIAHFRSRRVAMAALIAGETRLSEASRRRVLAYIDDFFAILDDPEQINERLVERCIR
jgi:hypothetical protein